MIKAGSCINPAPPPDIAENVLERKDIKKSKKLSYKEKILTSAKSVKNKFIIF